MYPPSPPCGGFEVMLGESLGRRIESSLEDVENSKPQPAAPSGRSNLNASRRALLKKGARRARAASSLQNKQNQNQLLHHHQNQLLHHHQNQSQLLHHHHQGQLLHHHQRQAVLLRSSSSQARLVDINNNSSASRTGAPTAELPASRTAAPAGTHLKPGGKKELLKLKTGRVERGNQSNGQSIHGLSKHEQSAPNLNVRSQKSKLVNAPGSVTLASKCESSSQQSAPVLLLAGRREGKRPLSSAEGSRSTNLSPSSEENLKDGEKTYAGAKFSEPPSPSVLPKPPSHWVGENSPKHSTSSREQMSVHLKTLLKVQAKP